VGRIAPSTPIALHPAEPGMCATLTRRQKSRYRRNDTYEARDFSSDVQGPEETACSMSEVSLLGPTARGRRGPGDGLLREARHSHQDKVRVRVLRRGDADQGRGQEQGHLRRDPWRRGRGVAGPSRKSIKLPRACSCGPGGVSDEGRHTGSWRGYAVASPDRF